MSIVKQFGAVILLAATPAQAEDALYRDIPANPLTDCVSKAMKAVMPAAPDYITVAKEVGSELSYEFQAGTNIEGTDDMSALKIVIYPRQTGMGSIELIATEKDLPDINAVAFGHMDKDRFEGSTTVTVTSTGAASGQAEQIVLDRMAGAIGLINNCMTPR